MATCPTSSPVITRQSQESKRGPWSSQETSWGLVPLQYGSRRARVPRAELKRASGPMGGVGGGPSWGWSGPSRPLGILGLSLFLPEQDKDLLLLFSWDNFTVPKPYSALAGLAVKIWSEFVAVVIPLKCHMFCALLRSCTALLP